MEPASLLPSAIAEVLSRGGTVVTANQRAARTLRRAFDRQSRAAGRTSWQPPRIMPWDAWVTALWNRLLLEGHTDRMVLNQSQELQVWASVISEDRAWSSLQTVESLAELAAEAWQLLCAYRGQQRLRNAGISEDTRAFQRWAQAFRRRCVADRFITQAELEEAIAVPIKSNEFRPSESELLLVGFDRKTPAQAALLDALRDSGISVESEPISSIAQQRFLSTVANPDEELSNAALWIRQTLTGNPEARIAVIVPDLAADRAELDRVFRQVLAPELQSIVYGDRGGPYEFSLGEPLARVPIVVAALAILRLASGSPPIEEISRLLLSPYFSTSANERSTRAEFDAFHLRQSSLLRPEVTLEALIKLIEEVPHSSRLNGLKSQLLGLRRTAVKLLSEVEKQRSHDDWAENIRELLRAAAWATGRTDSSVEFQGRRKWESALDELSTLDFAGGRRTFAEALAALEAILQRTLFAPESRDAPVQIMGPHEAAGSRFDAVWFLRASDLDWPVRPGISPWLGWQLQRDLGMPGSDAALDRTHARVLTHRIAASAATVVFSYASETSEGRQRPSPLLAELELEPLASLPEAEPTSAVALETIEDGGFIPLVDLTVRGGAALLQAQAACGFRAFAERRLYATPIDSVAPGMDARESGNVTHKAMEHLWSKLRTQAALRDLTLEERASQLNSSIRSALGELSEIAASPWDAAYMAMQHERLYALLNRWLDLELLRPAFEVRQREQEFEDVAIGPLHLNIRVDRVDRLLDEEGGEVLLDYKTGLVSHKDWGGDRPDEPQLPLYAVLREPGTVAAVAFATIRAGNEMELHGYAARDGALLKSARMDWESLDAQLEDWHRVLTALAEGFARGDARVRPKAYPVTCTYCAQRLLCRLDPSLVLGEPDETESAGEDNA
jgi:probable DNA repair protein